MSGKHEIQTQTSAQQISDVARSRVQKICAEFGLYGNIVEYRPSRLSGSSRNKTYLIASRFPEWGKAELPKGFDPDMYLRRNQRTETLLFYSDVFVYELGPNANELEAVQDLREYCMYTEFLLNLYDRFNMDPPFKLRRTELRELEDVRRMQRSHSNDRIWKNSTDALNDFFTKERKGGFHKEWMEFFRSEKFPSAEGPLGKMAAFRKRNSQIISKEQLDAFSGHVKTVEMQEHEYKRFLDFMQSKFSFVPFAVSDKIKVDNNASAMDATLEREFGKRVTGEAYARTLEARFAQEGWSCVSNLRPSSFEVRKVSFVASDEPYIATAFNDARFRYAKHDDVYTVESRGGELQLYPIPSESLMNFVELAKANGLPFYLDNMGVLETPSLDTASVFCSSKDEVIVLDILDRMKEESVVKSHLVPADERPKLDELLYHAEHLEQSTVRQQALPGESHRRERG